MPLLPLLPDGASLPTTAPCLLQEVTTPTGQWMYASPDLLAKHELTGAVAGILAASGGISDTAVAVLQVGAAR